MRFKFLIILLLFAACAKESEFEVSSDNPQFPNQTNAQRAVILSDSGKTEGIEFVAERVLELNESGIKGYLIQLYDPKRKDHSAELKIFRKIRFKEMDTVLYTGKYQFNSALIDSATHIAELSTIENGSNKSYKSVKYFKGQVKVQRAQGYWDLEIFSRLNKAGNPDLWFDLKSHLKFKNK